MKSADKLSKAAARFGLSHASPRNQGEGEAKKSISTMGCKLTHSAFRLVTIDVLRALAALAVLIVHIPHDIIGIGFGWRQIVTLPLDIGYLGVPLFLVISGFCIHLGVAKQIVSGQPRLSWGSFWHRRFFRLYPPYLVAGALSLGVYAFLQASPTAGNIQVINVKWDIVTHLLMLHNLFLDYSLGLANGPFWTLGLEEQLYALYAVYLLLRTRMSAAHLLTWAFLIAFIWRRGIPVAWTWAGVTDPNQQAIGIGALQLGAWWGWPPAHWFAWLLGAVAAEGYVGAVRLPVPWTNYWTAAFCFIFTAICNRAVMGRLRDSNWLQIHAAWWISPVLEMLIDIADLVFAIGCFVIVNKWVNAEATRCFPKQLLQPLAILGGMSYSLYLTHEPIIHILYMIWPAQTVQALVFRYAVYPPICLAFAFAFYHLVEKFFVNRSAYLPR